MDTMIDGRDLAWRDNQNENIVRITDFSQSDNIDVIWYRNTETLEESCMDLDSFLNKHTSCGLFDDLEIA
jgi:hypothetical protein